MRYFYALSDSYIKRTTTINKFQEKITLIISPKVKAQKVTINTNSFLYLANSAISMRAREFTKKGWPRKNVKGLKFLKKHTVDDEVSFFAHF